MLTSVPFILTELHLHSPPHLPCKPAKRSQKYMEPIRPFFLAGGCRHYRHAPLVRYPAVGGTLNSSSSSSSSGSSGIRSTNLAFGAHQRHSTTRAGIASSAFTTATAMVGRLDDLSMGYGSGACTTSRVGEFSFALDFGGAGMRHCRRRLSSIAIGADTDGPAVDEVGLGGATHDRRRCGPARSHPDDFANIAPGRQRKQRRRSPRNRQPRDGKVTASGADKHVCYSNHSAPNRRNISVAGTRVSSSSGPASEAELQRALRLHEKITLAHADPGIGLPLINAAESCLRVLAKMDDVTHHRHNTSARVLSLLEALQKSRPSGQSSTTNNVVSGQMYEYAIQILAKSGKGASKAGQLLHEYMDEWEKSMKCQKSEAQSPAAKAPKTTKIKKPPNTVLISSVIHALAKDNSKGAAIRAEQLLRRMVEMHSVYMEANPTATASPMEPNCVSFTAVVDAWSRRRKADRAQQVLNWMLRYASNTTHEQAMSYNDTSADTALRSRHLRPNAATFNAVIAAWAKTSPPSTEPTLSAKKAEVLVQAMKKVGVRPDAYSYASLLSAWTSIPQRPQGALKADEILRRMEVECDELARAAAVPNHNDDTWNPLNPVPPNRVCYNTVLDGFAKTEKPELAEDTLCRMVDRHERNPLTAPCPNRTSFNIVVQAWAKSGRADAGQKAQDLLEAMEEMAAKALDADGVKIAIEPDIFTYNSCLDGWMRGNSVNHATNAEKLLEKMALGRTANGVVPDRISYNTVIAAWAKAGRRNAWYRNSSKLGDENHLAKRAEAILYKMDASGIRPDTTSFNTCISAWSRSGQGKKAADRAEALLLAMEQLSEEGGSAEDEGSLVCPDGRTYSAVIEAIANSGDHDAPYRAQKVIERMKRISKKPNIFAYNSLINCWTRCSRNDRGAAARADEILAQLEKGGGDDDCLPAPDLVSYCTVIRAWADSADGNKAKRARNVLDRMLASSVSRASWRKRATAQKIRSGYNWVLTCCAYTPKYADECAREEARMIAMDTYQAMHSSNKTSPDEQTYVNFLLVCSHLFPLHSEERNKLVEVAMKDCHERGLVSKGVLGRLEQAASTHDLYAKLRAQIDDESN